VPEPLPPPLPPGERTVGQLVAETIRLYGSHFWLALPLGLSIALLDQLALGHSANAQTLVLWLCAPLLTASYVGAAAIVGGRRLELRPAARAFALGLLVFAPVPVLVRIYVLPAVAWLAFVGLAVPVAVLERRRLRDSLVRGRELGQADYVHALGSLATLVIVYVLTRTVLHFLLHSQGDAEQRVALGLADVVLSPLVFLGSALLYYDQAARLRDVRSSTRPRRKRDGDLHPALEPDRPGRADAEVEP
jgi:hypothetical protein